jgi:hypothetical protein
MKKVFISIAGIVIIALVLVLFINAKRALAKNETTPCSSTTTIVEKGEAVKEGCAEMPCCKEVK